MNYQEFDKSVVAVLVRECTKSVLTIEIDQHTMSGTSPGDMARDLEEEYEGFKFSEFFVKAN